MEKNPVTKTPEDGKTKGNKQEKKPDREVS